MPPAAAVTIARSPGRSVANCTMPKVVRPVPIMATAAAGSSVSGIACSCPVPVTASSA